VPNAVLRRRRRAGALSRPPRLRWTATGRVGAGRGGTGPAAVAGGILCGAGLTAVVFWLTQAGGL